jgi:sister-chromatid-cohesion protein PDS5
MSSRRKAAEVSQTKSLYGVNILNTYKKPAELTKYLTELQQDLVNLNQDVDQAPPGFSETVSFLNSPKLLASSDKKIKLLVSCCLVDVFRVYAPDTPYKDPEMLQVFETLNNQIRNLQVSAPGSEEQQKIIYILQSLASVKSCVIPVILAQKGVPDALEVVRSLFEAILDSVRPEHTNEGNNLA